LELDRLNKALAEAGSRAAAARAELELQMSRRGELQARQEQLLAAYAEARDRADGERAGVARLNVDFESRRVAQESAQASLARLQIQRAQIADRSRTLEAQIGAGGPAIASMQGELGEHLARKLEVDRALAARRGELEAVESRLRTNEGHRASAEKAVAAAREVVDGLRLQVREVEVRREAVVDAFMALGAQLDEVRAGLPADPDATRWQEDLDEVRRKIERLGPINLAAIEQFNEQSERKKYLDAQNDDLTAALDTLEQAIRKIDRETRARFQETFDNVNQGLKRIFPRLFGGGHAYLSLEGEDILAAGVTVMARPPGKRNSHIHLLSGGEKALTAVALIFSIFELNPAPFCLLDEVDAPLDEANVGRFCDIVREMSQRVQFVVITHNKTTMEMANQLTGVTMNEPGVSRLVSVDLDAAVQLAAS
jgi:chromosome segregation protein